MGLQAQNQPEAAFDFVHGAGGKSAEPLQQATAGHRAHATADRDAIGVDPFAR